MTSRGALVFAFALTLAAGCAKRAGPEPPPILFGQQECDECRMIISDERFAAALVFDEGDGEFRAVAFDDIGCLFAHEQANATLPVAARYVRDQSTRLWLSAEAASYVRSSSIETPMASGVAATASPQAAAEFTAAHGEPVTVLDWPALRRLFASGGPAVRDSTPGDRP